jgi:acetyl-CoA carboxylase biotin carboxyl carrier protein
MDINIGQVKELADIALDKQLSELIVTDGEKSITIKLPIVGNTHAAVVHTTGGTHQSVVYTPPAPPPVHEIAVNSSARSTEVFPAEPSPSYTEVTAPMVGTFYAASSPEAKPYVTVGQSVSKGQTLCIIEAMKMMNQLESDVSGKVVKILAKNGESVEYGQPLLWVDTNA